MTFYLRLQTAVNKGKTKVIETLLSERQAPLSENEILPVVRNAIGRSKEFALEALLNSDKVTGIIRETDRIELLKLCCKEGIHRSYPFLCVWGNARENGKLSNATALEVAFEVAKIPEDPDSSLQKFKEIWDGMLYYTRIKTQLLSSKELFVAVWTSTLKTKRDKEVRQALLHSFLYAFEVTLTQVDLKQMYDLPLQEAVANFRASLQTITKPCWKDSLSAMTTESMPHVVQVPDIRVHLADDSHGFGTAFGRHLACLEACPCPQSLPDLSATDKMAFNWNKRHSRQSFGSLLSDLSSDSLQIPSRSQRLNNSPHPSLYSIDTCYPSTGRNVVKIFSLTDYDDCDFRSRLESARIPYQLEAVFRKLGCNSGDVEVFSNPTAKEIEDVVDHICLEAEGTLQDASSLHVCIMAHGSFSKIFGTGGSPIKECDITSPIGKAFPNIPKFFVFQKCQKGSEGNGLSIQESYPVNSPEMCVVHTCMPGCQDFDDKGGSLFMRSLIESLEKYGSGWDYLKILQHTSNKLKNCVQKAVVSSNLSKSFDFKPSREV